MAILVYVAAVVALASLQLAGAQAPGDTSQDCLGLRAEGLSLVFYPANVRPLMDSRNYTDLLPPHSNPVWQRVDLDNNNPLGQTTEWTQFTNSPCEQRVQVCGFSAGAQNNWLITQHINRVVGGVPLAQVNVEVEFQLIGCNVSSSCQRTFVVNKYETSTISPSAAADTTNYVTVERLAPDDDSGTVAENQTAVLDFETGENGFYLGIQDETSCISISHVLVFYYVCPAGPKNLIAFPEEIAPPAGQGIQPVQSVGGCVSNASPTSGSIPVICTAGGVWTTTSVCSCDQGFTSNDDRTACILVSCPAGTYFSASGESCLPCPANSLTTVEGPNTECPCSSGFYRLPGEVDQACQLPPSPPREVVVVNLTETSVFLRWRPPENGGGDLVYALSYQEEGTEDIVEFGRVGNSTEGEITGLCPGIMYAFFVSSENALTEQIPLSELSNRAVTITSTTPGGPDRQSTTIIIVVTVVVVVVVAVVIVVIVVIFASVKMRKSKIVERNEVPEYAMVDSAPPLPQPRVITAVNTAYQAPGAIRDSEYEAMDNSAEYEVPTFENTAYGSSNQPAAVAISSQIAGDREYEAVDRPTATDCATVPTVENVAYGQFTGTSRP